MATPLLNEIEHLLAKERHERTIRSRAARFLIGLNHGSVDIDPSHYAGTAFVLVNHVVPWVHEQGRRQPLVVDVGAFFGSFVAAIWPLCPVIGLECAPFAFLAGRLAGHHQLRFGSARKLDQLFGASSVDALCYVNFFPSHSVKRFGDPEPYLAAAAAALRPGGWLLIRHADGLTAESLQRQGFLQEMLPIPPYCEPVQVYRRLSPA